MYVSSIADKEDSPWGSVKSPVGRQAKKVSATAECVRKQEDQIMSLPMQMDFSLELTEGSDASSTGP